jgi:hypothetical protein
MELQLARPWHQPAKLACLTELCTNMHQLFRDGSKARKQSTEAKRSKAKQSPYCLSQYVTKLVTMAYNGDAIRSTRQIKTMQSFNQFHSKCNQLEINLKSTKRHIFVADFD